MPAQATSAAPARWAGPLVRSARAEWVRLSRPVPLVRTLGALALAAAAMTLVTVLDQTSGGVGPGTLGFAMTAPDGLVAGLGNAALLLGVVVVSVGAVSGAGEYGHGTLRNLLLRQPRRARLLAGKLLALVALAGLGSVAAAAAGVLTAVAAGRARGLDEHWWFTAAGAGQVLRATTQLAACLAGFALLGLAAGVLARGTALAVGAGVGWTLVAENVAAAARPGLARWLPGQLLTGVASGGDTLGVGWELVRFAGYALALGAVTVWVFARRDVTT